MLQIIEHDLSQILPLTENRFLLILAEIMNASLFPRLVTCLSSYICVCNETHQCVQVDVGPLNLLGLPAFLNHGPAQNIEILLWRQDQRRASVSMFYMHFSHSTTRGHNRPLV